MRNVVGFLLMVLLLSGCIHPEEKKDYDFSGADLYEVLSPDNKRFDLSGLVKVNSEIIGVADKPWNKFLYSITPGDSGNVDTTNILHALSYDFESDFEAIDYSDNSFYIADERHSMIYQLDIRTDQLTPITLSWPQEVNIDDWGNAGIEAMAVDSEGYIYIGKERDDPALFRASLSDGSVVSLELNDFPDNFDVSDMKYENQHLYFLNRGNYQIIKWDIETKEIVNHFDYSFVLNAGGEKAYSGSRYPMAEGLILTSEHIWIALDNNGDLYNKKNPWIEMSNFAGENPLLVCFNRPKGF
jgi:uncharacterized protein YjiK